MKNIESKIRGFCRILLLIVFVAAAVFGGLNLMGENKTKTAHADTALTAAQVSSIGYEYRMYTFSGSTFWNGYGVGSTNDREPMLYHTGTGNLLCWYQYAPTQTTSFNGLAFKTISNGGSFVPCAGSTVGYSSANTTGSYSVYLYGPFSGNPAWGSVSTTPVLYKDSGGYVYCIIEGITYYLTSTGSATTSKSSATPLFLTNVSSSVQTVVTSPVALTYTGSSQTHPGAYAYSSYFTFAGTTSATAVGTYTYYVTPRSGYAWSDGSTGTKTVTWKITQADGTPVLSAPSKILANATGSLAVTTNSTGEVSYTSSDSTLVSVSGTGKAATLTGGNKLGAVTVTVAVAADANYKAGVATVQVTNCLENGFYIVKSDGGKYAYDSLKAAYADLGDSTDQTIYVIGNPTVDEPLVVRAGEEVKIAAGDSAVSMTAPNNAVISRAESMTGSIFTVEGGGTLSIEGITLDGEGVSGDPLIASAGDLTIGDGTTVRNGNSTNGGAVYVSGGKTTVGSGASLNSNTATNGGAVYVSGGELTVGAGASLNTNTATNGGAVYIASGALVNVSADSSLMSNKASGNGGAIYVEDSASAVTVSGGTIANNSAGGCGNGIYIENGKLLTVDFSAIGGLSDGIGIGGNGQVNMTGNSTDAGGMLMISFANPETQKGGTYVVSADGTDASLKTHIRVQNAGYDFSETSGENGGLSLTTSTEQCAYLMYVAEDGSVWYEGYTSISAAIEASQTKTTYKDSDGKEYKLSDATIYLPQFVYEDQTKYPYAENAKGEIAVTDTIVIPDGANIKFDTLIKFVEEGESESSTNAYYTYDGFSEKLNASGEGAISVSGLSAEDLMPSVLKRSVNLTDEMVLVKQGGSLTIANATLDGGAVWQGGSVQIADDGKGGAGTVQTNNLGITAHAPVIVNQGTLTVKDGATIQNNDNNYAAPGEGFGSQNYGGGIRNEGSATMNMMGGSIENCYSREGGAIMNVNKPGTEGYVAPGEDGVGPTVTVSGGTIAGNVSQQKGAAVQTIYGGATTTVTGNAKIEGNWSLNDLGVLAVEEGGELTVSGGEVSTVTAERGWTDLNENTVDNANVIYLYNKYSDDDYANAATKPFIEGMGAGELNLTGAPVLSGDVHIDGACTVVNSTTYYEPYVDISGYTGGMISVDLSEGAAYGKVALNSTDDFSKLAVNLSDNGLSADFTYTQEANGSYTLLTSGYNLEVGQTESGKLTVTGDCDPAIESIALKIGDQTYTISKENGGISENGKVAFDLDLNGIKGTEFTAEISVGVGNGTQTVSTVSLKTVKFDPLTGEVTAPTGTTYISSNGEETSLTTGTLPNDIVIDENGNITVRVDGEERKIQVGMRTQEIEGDVGTELFDIGNTSLRVKVDEAFYGLEYNLVYTDGEGNEVLVSSNWQKPDENGYIAFEGLSEVVAYTVVVRNPAQTDEQGVTSIPSAYKECKDSTYETESTYTTLAKAQQAAKESFETGYEDIESKLLEVDEEGNVTNELTATAAEIKALIDNYDALADDVKTIRTFKMKIARLNNSYDHALAKEWEEDNSDVIGKVSGDGFDGNVGDYNGDGVTDAADAALYRDDLEKAIGAYEDESFTEGARALVADKYADLIEAYKLLINDQLDGILEEGVKAGADSESLKAIVDGYKNDVAGAVSKADIDALYEKAQLAADLRTEYDKIVKDSGNDMTEQSRTELNGLLAQSLEDIRNAPASDDLQATYNAAVIKLHRKQAEGILSNRYGQIAADYESGESGIVSDIQKDEIKKVYDEYLDGILNADDGTDFVAAADAAVLALDRAEAKAILNDYLREESDGAAVKEIVTAATDENGSIDQATDKNAIDQIVADAKKEIAVARIKAAIQAMQSELTAAGYDADAVAERMNGKSGDDTDAGVYGILGDLNGNGGAQAEINAQDFAQDPAAYADGKIAEAETYLAEFDRKRFTGEHADILGKSVSEIVKTDIATIDGALNDLATYIETSQDNMDDLRNDLLAKKKAAIIAALGDENGAKLSTVGTVLNQYIDKINGVKTDGDTLSDGEANKALDLLWEQAQAAADYLESYYYINGAEADVNGETVSAVLSAIESGTDVAGINAALENGVLAELNKILHRDADGALTDSPATEGSTAPSTEGLVNAVKEAVAQAVVSANGAKTVADLSNEVKNVKANVEEQRTAEKTAAKAEIEEAVSQSVAGLSEAGQAKAGQLIDEAKKAIDDGDYVEYPLIVARIRAKISVLGAVDALMQQAEEAGLKDVSALGAAAEAVYAEIDGITDLSTLESYAAQVPADVLLTLQKGYAVADLESFADGSDLQSITDLLEEAKTQIGGAQDETAINAIVSATKTAMTGERYIDGNPVLQKEFAEIDGNDLSALEEAKTQYEALSEEEKAYLDAEYKGEYDSFVGLIEDAINKAEFEAHKASVIAELEKLIGENDGEFVRSVYEAQIATVNGISYEACTADSDRSGYVQQKSNDLDTAFESSKTETKHAQVQQGAVNQGEQYYKDKLNDSKYLYSDGQKAQLKNLIDAFEADVYAVTSQEQNVQEALDELVANVKKAIDDAPITAVVKGDLSATGGDAEYGEEEDGKEIWGIVTNDSGMEGGVVLIIEKVEEEREQQIKNALSEGKTVIADGSNLTEEELSALIDGKEVKSTVDIYLLKDNVKITQFNGMYIVKILLDSEMRSMSGLQVVYLDDNGDVQVYETTIEDGKYLVFTTAHFSEFVILGESELNLWWLIITLSVLFAIELIAIVVVLSKRKKNGQAEKTSAFVPVASLLTVIIPNGAVTACIVLGVCIVVAGALLAVFALKKSSKQDAVKEDAAPEKTVIIVEKTATEKTIVFAGTTALEETTVTEEVAAADEETTVSEEVAATEETAVSEEATAADEETTVSEEVAASDEETTVSEEVAATEETAVSEEIIATEETAVSEEAAPADEEMAVSEETVTADEETTVSEEVVATEETAVTEEATASDEETTVSEEATASDEETAVTEETATADEKAAVTEETATADEKAAVTTDEEMAVADEAAIAAVAAVAAVSGDEEDTETIYDPVTNRYITIKYSKSFLAKLIQSDEATKSYYEELKNEIMSYGAKSRVSWRYESFRKARKLLIKMQMRGKTLCLCFALSASDYAESKYKVEDYSDVKVLEDTPCLYRIKNMRRCRYAKDLIADVMRQYGLQRGDGQSVSYAQELPYESTSDLISKGLIRVLSKEGTQSSKAFIPAKTVAEEEVTSGAQLPVVEVRHEVNATEVDAILGDAEAKALVVSSVRYADKTKTGIINVDTISQFFKDGEKVTLEEIKGRVPGFPKKTTYIKVLARGTLDKPLTVEADDFSIEAVKMILLTGGKVVRTLVRDDK